MIILRRPLLQVYVRARFLTQYRSPKAIYREQQLRLEFSNDIMLYVLELCGERSAGSLCLKVRLRSKVSHRVSRGQAMGAGGVGPLRVESPHARAQHAHSKNSWMHVAWV